MGFPVQRELLGAILPGSYAEQRHRVRVPLASSGKGVTQSGGICTALLKLQGQSWPLLTRTCLGPPRCVGLPETARRALFGHRPGHLILKLS
jgi:hypothetical protein